MLFLPRVGKLAQGETEALAGEIGSPGFLRNDEAAELDDELEAIGAGDGIPTDPRIAVLESLGGTGPTQDGDKILATIFRVMFVNPLPQDMPGGAACFEVVLYIQDGAELWLISNGSEAVRI